MQNQASMVPLGHDMTMTHYTYPITIEKEGRQYYAYSEDLKGVYGIGTTIEEVKTSILEAIRLYIFAMQENGASCPSCPARFNRDRFRRDRLNAVRQRSGSISAQPGLQRGSPDRVPSDS
jgi:predicted RNase H-like HicB family nuclease